MQHCAPYKRQLVTGWNDTIHTVSKKKTVSKKMELTATAIDNV